MVMFNVTHSERSPTMTTAKDKPAAAAIKDLLSQSPDGLREIVRAVMQEMLEAEMTDALQAEKGERTSARLGYRSGYYTRTLVTRVGKLELRCEREGRRCCDAGLGHSRLGGHLVEGQAAGVRSRAGKADTAIFAHGGQLTAFCHTAVETENQKSVLPACTVKRYSNAADRIARHRQVHLERPRVPHQNVPVADMDDAVAAPEPEVGLGQSISQRLGAGNRHEVLAVGAAKKNGVKHEFGSH
jgi:hypothetical protein